jgi:hypothetical protein
VSTWYFEKAIPRGVCGGVTASAFVNRFRGVKILFFS